MLDQIFWVALVAFIVGAVVMAAKKNTIGVVTTILVGAVVCYFIKNPTTLSDIGERLWVYCIAIKELCNGRRKETECDCVFLS